MDPIDAFRERRVHRLHLLGAIPGPITPEATPQRKRDRKKRPDPAKLLQRRKDHSR